MTVASSHAPACWVHSNLPCHHGYAPVPGQPLVLVRAVPSLPGRPAFLPGYAVVRVVRVPVNRHGCLVWMRSRITSRTVTPFRCRLVGSAPRVLTPAYDPRLRAALDTARVAGFAATACPGMPCCVCGFCRYALPVLFAWRWRCPSTWVVCLIAL